MIFARCDTEKFSAASSFYIIRSVSLNSHEAQPDNDTSTCNFLMKLHIIWPRLTQTSPSRSITKLASYGDSALVLVFTGACVETETFRRQIFLNTNFAECSFDFFNRFWFTKRDARRFTQCSSADKPEIFMKKKFQQKKCRNLEMYQKKLLITI